MGPAVLTIARTGSEPTCPFGMADKTAAADTLIGTGRHFKPLRSTVHTLMVDGQGFLI
jgi:hypothetical protein